jgi:heme-degrading monooxygenase HmoA
MITSVITEQAVLDVRQGREAEFESAFERARAIIASMPGFVSLRLLRCLEAPHRYLLLVEWERLEDHTVGFRRSTEYEKWKALLHHFYDPVPVVEHFTLVSKG